MPRFVRFGLGCAMIAALTFVLSSTASAHERRDVGGGQYRFVIGFLNEPTFVGDKSGLDLRITTVPAGTPAADGEQPAGTPIEGLETTLQAEVIYGDQRLALPLEPSFRDPGAYSSVFFPMAEGDYSFHIFGDIQGTAIDETFTSGPETFGPIQARQPLEFPQQTGSVGGTTAGTVIGGGSDGGNGGLLAGAGLGALIGAAGLILVQRRFGGRREPAGVTVRA